MRILASALILLLASAPMQATELYCSTMPFASAKIWIHIAGGQVIIKPVQKENKDEETNSTSK